MHTNINMFDKLTLTNSRLFKANLGNSRTFEALYSENKIQTHSRFSMPCTNPAIPAYCDRQQLTYVIGNADELLL